MGLDEFCNLIRKSYPEISSKADAEYEKYWNTYIKIDFSSYSWFASLATAINIEMNKKVSPNNYKNLFEEISKGFSVGEEEVKNAIDVSFVENLFWQVSEKESQTYWAELPETLKILYLGFHHRLPF